MANETSQDLLVSVPYLSYDDIAEASRSFLERYGEFDSIPVNIGLMAERDLGLDIVPLPYLERHLGIAGCTSHDQSRIYVDDRTCDEVPVRYRFTLAHEVGHIELHSGVFRSLRFDTPEEWLVMQQSLDPNAARWLESQANAFAAYTLVRPEHLAGFYKDALPVGLEVVEEAKRHKASRDGYLSYAVDAIARELAPVFEVSVVCMTNRILNDGLDEQIP